MPIDHCPVTLLNVPLVVDALTKVYPEFKISETITLVASFCPSLLAVKVKVILEPKTGFILLAVFVILKSAKHWLKFI